MINRRRLKRAAPAEAEPSHDNQSVDIQHALRLGWSIAETFGRLRVYQPEFANKRNDPNEMPRFSFSNSDLSGGQQLEVSYRRLIELAEALKLQQPDVPELARLLSIQSEALDLQSRKLIHEALENWSRNAWIQLNVRSAALGRAMTYGGSLADTYWYMAAPESEAFLSGRQSIDALLRVHRLRRMQERMQEVGEAFSGETCDAISASLQHWLLDDRKLAWAQAKDWSTLGVSVDQQPRRTPPQQLHFNLFRQVRTWRDLLFESRQPLDYVSPGFRRRANIVAGTVTILLVLLIALAVGLGIFFLFNGALRVVRSMNVLPSGTGDLVEAISVFVSLLSTLAIVTASLLARASTAVQQFDTWLEQSILRRAIRKQTITHWNDPPRRREEG